MYGSAAPDSFLFGPAKPRSVFCNSVLWSFSFGTGNWSKGNNGPLILVGNGDEQALFWNICCELSWQHLSI